MYPISYNSSEPSVHLGYMIIIQDIVLPIVLADSGWLNSSLKRSSYGNRFNYLRQ